MSQELIDAAGEAMKLAYCPYSKFHVGAAVLCDDGTIVQGCNIENASYGLTCCAERVALFTAIAQDKVPVSIAVSCDANYNTPIEYRMPCGACRQVIAEFLPDNAKVYIDTVGTYEVRDLIPYAFRI